MRPRDFASVFAILMSALTGGAPITARAAEGATTAPATASATMPAPANESATAAVAAKRSALREYDRFLDHHPLLEDELRLDPSLTLNSAFLTKTPELRGFMRSNPRVADGLALYPRYYLNRALLRQASAPLAYAELSPLWDLFVQDIRLEKELKTNPELIRDPTFLDVRPALHECLTTHAALARVFLPSPSLPNP